MKKKTQQTQTTECLLTFLLKGAESHCAINSSDICKRTRPSESSIGGMPVAITTIISAVATSIPVGSLGVPRGGIREEQSLVFIHSKSKA